MKNKYVYLGVIISLSVASLYFFQSCGVAGDSAQVSFSSLPIYTPEGDATLVAEELEITPSGCTDSTTPICDGGPDTLRKSWTPLENYKFLGATSANGAINTNTILRSNSNSPAARYCADMIYGGFSDWYLPSREEMMAIFLKRYEYGHLNNDFYWTSTEISSGYAYVQTLIVPSFLVGVPATSETIFKATSLAVRCIRKSKTKS